MIINSNTEVISYKIKRLKNRREQITYKPKLKAIAMPIPRQINAKKIKRLHMYQGAGIDGTATSQKRLKLAAERNQALRKSHQRLRRLRMIKRSLKWARF